MNHYQRALAALIAASGSACQVAEPPDCAPGEVMYRGADEWTCLPLSAMLNAPTDCQSGEYLRFDGTKIDCVALDGVSLVAVGEGLSGGGTGDVSLAVDFEAVATKDHVHEGAGDITRVGTAAASGLRGGVDAGDADLAVVFGQTATTVARGSHVHQWPELASVPQNLLDIALLSCSSGDFLGENAGRLSCVSGPVVGPTLGGLTCSSSGDLATWTGTQWDCAAPSPGTSLWTAGPAGGVHNGGPVGVGGIAPSGTHLWVQDSIGGNEVTSGVFNGDASGGAETIMRVARPGGGSGGIDLKYFGESDTAFFSSGVPHAGNAGLLKVGPQPTELAMDFNGYTFADGASTLMSIQNGDVGIGTPSPSQALDVARAGANIRIFDPTTTARPALIIENSGSRRWTIGADAQDAGKLIVESDLAGGSPNSVLTIARTGDVGIGTITPTARLEVQAADPAAWAGFFHNDDPVGPGLLVRAGAGAQGSSFQVNNAANTTIFDIRADGSVSANGTCAHGPCLSDSRLKKNIFAVPQALRKLLALRGVTYEWREVSNEAQEGPQLGFIAQEVEQAFPRWVGENDLGFKTVEIRGFEPLVVEAMRDLASENDVLEATVAKLSAEVVGLQAERDELESRLTRLEVLVERLASEKEAVP